jgi:hypothetical protein
MSGGVLNTALAEPFASGRNKPALIGAGCAVNTQS